MSTQRGVAARAARVVELHLPDDHFFADDEVYLTQEYYNDANTTVLEVPRYGWRVKEVTGDTAVIQYQRRNLKLLMTLTIQTKYLKREI